MQTEAEQFAAIDACEGNTMITFSDIALAMRYVAHRERAGISGVIAMVEDTRTQSGLCVMWRDPIPAKDILERQANCRWMLEKTLAGEYAKPVPGEINENWTGGFPGTMDDPNYGGRT